jgi:hypothetical protein
MDEELRLGLGGPFWRLERSSHLEALVRLVPALIACTWIPVMLCALLDRLRGVPADPLVRDPRLHVRLLVALPLLAVSERVLDRLSCEAITRLFAEGFVPPQSAARLRRILRRVTGWCDAALPEAVLLVGAVLLAAFTFAHSASVAASQGAPPRPLGIWYGLVARPLFDFVLCRSLFRWLLWLSVLVSLGRLPLRLLAEHADRHAGIAFLKTPTNGYVAVVMFAVSSLVCAGLSVQLAKGGTGIERVRPLFYGGAIIVVVVAFAPLLVFVPQLVRVRLAGRREYGGLVSDYARRFHERWIERGERRELLGSSDFQSMADLSTTYRENVERMQVVLFNTRDCAALLVAAFLPALPLLFLAAPASEVLHRILRLALGRLPR